ncbi:hypothetical protein PR048_028376 [Dryococelus australis]|uniref:Uncharacterized protein n=1 Tax=Dryococelus australis TaxID=614101 RepID=A0ABQ9GJ43_9NEOP|nr:hypothetical protein PR048_028376 [Dryococelus australis]
MCSSLEQFNIKTGCFFYGKRDSARTETNIGRTIQEVTTPIFNEHVLDQARSQNEWGAVVSIPAEAALVLVAAESKPHKEYIVGKNTVINGKRTADSILYETCYRELKRSDVDERQYIVVKAGEITREDILTTRYNCKYSSGEESSLCKDTVPGIVNPASHTKEVAITEERFDRALHPSGEQFDNIDDLRLHPYNHVVVLYSIPQTSVTAGSVRREAMEDEGRSQRYGKVVNSREREIIKSVITCCDEEAKNCCLLEPLRRATPRAARYKAGGQ